MAVVTVSAVAVLLATVVLFGLRLTPSGVGGGDVTWVSAGVRAVQTGTHVYAALYTRTDIFMHGSLYSFVFGQILFLEINV